MERFRQDKRTDDQISAYRNALVSETSQEELARLAHALDPDLRRTIDQMRILRQRDRPSPDPAFTNRLEREVLDAFYQIYGESIPPRATPPLALNGHVSRQEPDAHGLVALGGRQKWTGASLATAALLLLTLTAGLIAGWAFSRPHSSMVLEAAHSPAVETLVDSTIEGAAKDWTPMTVEHWTFQPGPAALTIPALEGPQWLVADTGSAVIIIDGVSQDLPTDSVVVIPAGAALVVRNPGNSALSMYRGVAAAGFSFEDYDRGVISKETALDTEAHEALPPGTSRVVFERLTLYAGTTFLLEPVSGQDWLDIASGELGVTLIGDGVPLNWQSGHEREIAGGEMLPALVPGTRVSLRNIGNDPLVLLRLRVISSASTSKSGLDTPLSSGVVQATTVAPAVGERAE